MSVWVRPSVNAFTRCLDERQRDEKKEHFSLLAFFFLNTRVVILYNIMQQKNVYTGNHGLTWWSSEFCSCFILLVSIFGDCSVFLFAVFFC